MDERNLDTCVDCDRLIYPDGSKLVEIVDERECTWHFSCFEKARPAYAAQLRLEHERWNSWTPAY